MRSNFFRFCPFFSIRLLEAIELLFLVEKCIIILKMKKQSVLTTKKV